MIIYRESEGVVEVSMTADEFNRSELPSKGWSDQVPMAKRQDVVWGKIKEYRDVLIQSGGYLVDGKWYHSDLMSRTQQIGLTLLGNNIPADLMWKTMDGSFVQMTPPLAQQIFVAAATSDTKIFICAEQHNAAMMLLPNPETYDYTSGWPSTFPNV